MKNESIKRLRQVSGAGILDCQKSLEQAKGDFDKALEILRKKGKKIVQSKGSRSTNEGIIESYIHSNAKIGVLVQLVCETDFVARNEAFKSLAHDIAMQIAATDPKWISSEDIPPEVIKKEKQIYQQTVDKNKPAKVAKNIVDGKLQKFYTEACLLKQPFIKDDALTVKQLIEKKIAVLGENIQIKRFIRFEL